MKDWQHGYSMEELLAVEKNFHAYNHLVLSPFAQVKKNKVAMLLHENKLDGYALPPKKVGHSDRIAWIPTNVAKSAVHVRAYNGVDIGVRQRGERMIDNPVGDERLLVDKIGDYKENIWMMINSQYDKGISVAKRLNFKKIGIKVNSFSDIINVYVKQNTKERMNIRKMPIIERLHIKKVGGISTKSLTLMQIKVDEIGEKFKNHYSNYNKGKAWSALSLKGYDANPEMIEKPSEMNDKWQKEHINYDFFLQETSLMDYFKPAINDILHMIPAETERIRLMRLEPTGGELQRHTDQTDKELGTTDGKIMRFHIPIVTTNKVFFHSWDWKGNETINNMGVGEIWYLDIRKPHKAINWGDVPRIHLVIDVVVNQNIHDLVIQS